VTSTPTPTASTTSRVGRSTQACLGAAVALAALVGACTGDDSGQERSAAGVCRILNASPEFAELARDFDPTDVPRGLVTLEAMDVHLEQIRDVMPDEGRDEIDRQLDYVRALRTALERVDPDDPQAVAAAVNGLADEAAAANLASADLQRFQDTRCTTPTVAPSVTGPPAGA
jgi:hypothetical protein